jgi:hypothetical protein
MSVNCQEALKRRRMLGPAIILLVGATCESKSNSTTTTILQYLGHTMPREADISVNERAFILQALQERIRLDGRAFDAFRPLELTFGDEYGIVDVQLGKTRYEHDIWRYFGY